MNQLKQFAVVFAVVAVVAGSVGASGASAASMDDIRAQLQSLQAQLQVLLQRVGALSQTITSPLPVQQAAQPASSGYIAIDEVAGTPSVSCALPVLKQRASADSVFLLQLLLKQEGSYPEGFVTGYYGKLTQAAVERFQVSAGLDKTGYVDEKTATILTELSAKFYPGECGVPQPPVGRCEFAQPPQGCRWEGSMTYPQCEARLVCDWTNPPVISGVSGPQALNVNQQGTWTVRASDPSGGSLSYSADWGDTPVCVYQCPLMAQQNQTQQSATFTHSYSQAGIYTPTFTVTNTSGQSAQTSLSVNVGRTTAPSITVTSPAAGETWRAGGTYALRWSGGAGNIVGIRLIDQSLESVGGSASIVWRVDNIPNTGSYQFAIPSNLSGTYRFYIDNLNYQGYSGYFQISGTQSSITVTSPQQGETWRAGEKREIRWTTNDPTMRPSLGRVTITLNEPYLACFDSVPACSAPMGPVRLPYVIAENVVDSGSYAWEIPASLPEGYRGSAQITVARTGESGLLGRSGAFTIAGPAIVNPGACVPWINPSAPAIREAGPADYGISPLHVFAAAEDSALTGEGSFVKIPDAGEVFVYSQFPEWAGDRMLLTVRQIKAALAAGTKVSINASKIIKANIASKVKLNVENCSNVPIGYQSRLTDLARQGGDLREIELVNYKDVRVDSQKISFSGGDIESVSDVTMTTGGSVYLITVYGKEGNPLLNIVSNARTQDGRSLIEKARDVLVGAIGDASKAIVATDPHYDDPIYTIAGIRKGYTAFTNQVFVDGSVVAIISGQQLLLANIASAVEKLGTLIYQAR